MLLECQCLAYGACSPHGITLQGVKSGKHEVVKEAVREVPSERDSLKAEVASLTKQVSHMQSELQQAAKEKKHADQHAPAAGKQELQVCHRSHACQTQLLQVLDLVSSTLIGDCGDIRPVTMV